MEKDEQDYSRPVAYDANGQPLYAHPPITPVKGPNQPAAKVEEVASDADTRHAESVRLHPDLNLSEGEYVIMTVRRHPIALLVPLGIGVLLLGLALALVANYDLVVNALNLTGQWADITTVLFPVLLFSVLIVVFMYIVYFVYNDNRFHLTNESVIQKIRYSLLAKQEQTISLGDVEDVNYSQRGLLQLFLNYGSIRLSTMGDEHTYNFLYVAHPKEQAATINNSVEAFKNGRHIR